MSHAITDAMTAVPCKRGHTERYSSGRCKGCERIAKRQYHQKAPVREREKQRLYLFHLKKTYGITPQQYGALFTAQGGRCAICRTDDPGSKLLRWHIDHCHSTGTVRGILCAQCNVMIGMAREDGRILEAGIRYLEETPCR